MASSCAECLNVVVSYCIFVGLEKTLIIVPILTVIVLFIHAEHVRRAIEAQLHSIVSRYVTTNLVCVKVEILLPVSFCGQNVAAQEIAS